MGQVLQSRRLGLECGTEGAGISGLSGDFLCSSTQGRVATVPRGWSMGPEAACSGLSQLRDLRLYESMGKISSCTLGPVR